MTVYNIAADADDGQSEGAAWSPRSGSYGAGGPQEYFNVGDKAGGRAGGVRFINITETGTVTSATLTIGLHQNASKNMTLTVEADDVDNAAAFGGSSHPGSGWTATTATATGNVISTDTAGTTYAIDVATVIQEIFDRGGWASGNAIRLAIRYTSGSPTYNQVSFEEFDTTSTVAPTLEIVTGAAAPTITDVNTDEIVAEGETGVTITGAGFTTDTGSADIVLVKTDAVAGPNATSQTETGTRTDTSAEFTAAFPTDVAEGETCYVFVVDSAGVSNTNGFLITREDITAPTLTSPTAGSITQTGVTPSCSTNEATGTMYMVVVPNGDVPSVAQIKLGQQSSGAAAIASDNDPISATGVHVFAAVTGLTLSTSYELYFVHTDVSGNDSLAATVGFTTLAAVSYTTSEGLVNNTGSLLLSTAVSWSWIPLGRIGSINGITVLDGTDTTDAVTGTVTATGMSAGAGILLVADLVTDATDDLVYYEAGTAA